MPANVGLASKAEVRAFNINFRFTPKSGYRTRRKGCSLRVKSENESSHQILAVPNFQTAAGCHRPYTAVPLKPRRFDACSTSLSARISASKIATRRVKLGRTGTSVPATDAEACGRDRAREKRLFTGYRNDTAAVLAALNVSVQPSLRENLGGTNRC
jgi:hypothetical protein